MWRWLCLPLATGCIISEDSAADRLTWWFDASAGYLTTCGLLASGTVECWGSQEASPPDLTFRQVSAGFDVGCGVTDDEDVACWGAQSSALLDVPAFDSDVAHVSTLAFDVCATTDDGAVICWGDTPAVAQVPAGRFDRVAVGEGYACALGRDQDLVCWGDDNQGGTAAPAGYYEDVDAADDHSCAVSADDSSIVCWGDATFSELRGEFAQVACGWDFVCGLDYDGHVQCVDTTGQTIHEPPDRRRFTTIDAGYSYVCGVSYDGRAVCWGDDDFGATDVPHNPRAGD